MNPNRWRQISAIYEAAVVRIGADRASYLAQVCGTDEGLRRDVESLLAQAAHESFLVTPVALPAGSRLGAYELLSVIGAGGMGVVYRAHDPKLHRDVALKVLPEAFALDPDRLARFRREAQVLASLNHPNIAAIYGFEDSGETHALVLELVEGPTLADRIARGAIPLDEALPIARQIAEALEAAHEQGIIHRDLKPANVKVRDDGTVKVLDFGLAKALEPTGSARQVVGQASLSPTITSPAMMTGVGVLLGTAAYMSPEQAKGRPADKRSDIWAFGCVLYEMLTSKRAFDGEDVTDTLAAVLRSGPRWDALASTSQSIRRLLQRCLEKEPRRRLASIADARLELEDAVEAGAVAPAPESSSRAASGLRVALIAACTGVVAAAAAAVGMWYAVRPSAPEVTRTALGLIGDTALDVSASERDLAITPDGTRIVYVGNKGTQLFVRSLDALEPVAIATGRPRGVFLSPDGEWAGYVDEGGNTLMKVALTGGPPVRLMQFTPGLSGATWASDETIIFATAGGGSLQRGLMRVSAQGGEATALTRPNLERGEGRHSWPTLLPGGGAVLFTSGADSNGSGDIGALDLKTGTYRIILHGGTDPHYASSGHLVYNAAGALRAVRFDLTRLEVIGTPVTVVPRVASKRSGAADFDVTPGGSLAYVRGPDRERAPNANTVVWVDRSGREEPLSTLRQRGYVAPRVSPDGTRAVFDVRGEDAGIWMWDFARASATKLTLKESIGPVWSPDGSQLAFNTNVGNFANIFLQPVNGGNARHLIPINRTQIPTSFTPDGTRLVFYEVTPAGQRDVMMFALVGASGVTRLLTSPADELNAVVSPDGRWLAYESNQSGRFEVYVRPFPAVSEALWRVSNGGGIRPVWTRGGRELVYLDPDDVLMGVRVDVGSAVWQASEATKVLDVSRYYTGSLTSRTFDVSADGERFLMLKPASADDPAIGDVVVVQNWQEELKRLVPTK